MEILAAVMTVLIRTKIKRQSMIGAYIVKEGQRIHRADHIATVKKPYVRKNIASVLTPVFHAQSSANATDAPTADLIELFILFFLLFCSFLFISIL